MNLNIKIRGNDKKEILKISMIMILINIIITIIVAIFAHVDILKNIILYAISIIYIGYVVYIVKKENEEKMVKSQNDFENKYDPILTKFLVKNEFELDENLLNAEIYYLIRKGYVYIDKEKNILKLKDRNQFKQIDALERIDSNKIKEYSTEEIPSYESMFIGKILFAFRDEIGIQELHKNIKENYYYQRGEICKLAMEKMLLYEIEKHNMLGNGSNINLISIVSILNIITAIILFAVMGRFNVILLLAMALNIALNVIIIKNENILSYKYSDEVIKYIDDLEEYTQELKVKKSDLEVEELKLENSEQEIKYEDMDEEENSEEQYTDELDIEKSNIDKEEIKKNEDDEQLKLLFGIEKIDKINQLV